MDAKELLKHVKIMLKVVDKDPTLPSIANLMVMGGKLIGTDLETTISIDIGVKGHFLINADDLHKILSVVKGEVSFKPNKKSDKIELTCGNKKYTLESGDVKNFPQIVKIGKKLFSLEEADIKHIITAANFVGKDELRYMLCGIHFGKKNIVSTDAHVMYYPPLSNTRKGEIFTVPSVLGDLIGGLKNLTVYQKENNFTFKDGIYEFSMRALDGKYPNWENVIYKGKKGIINVERKSLIESIKASAPCNPPHTHKLEISYHNDNHIRIKVSNDDNFFEELLDSKNKGACDFAVNSKFLKLILDNIKEEKIQIKYNTERQQILIDSQFLLMPIAKESY